MDVRAGDADDRPTGRTGRGHLAEQKLPEIDALIARAPAIQGWLASAGECFCQSLDVCRLFDGLDPVGEAPTGDPAKT